MDAERFDRITKSLQAATTRRRVLGGLTLGAFAGLLRWHSADAAECAKPGQKPKDDRPCCVGTAVDGRCPEETPRMGLCATESVPVASCVCIDPTDPFGAVCGGCAEAPPPSAHRRIRASAGRHCSNAADCAMSGGRRVATPMSVQVSHRSLGGMGIPTVTRAQV